MADELARQDREAQDHYDRFTEAFYMDGWNREHFHFGLFEEGDGPSFGEELTDSACLKRAIRRMEVAIVEPARIVERDLVVDAGCGVGGTTLAVAQEYGCRTVGITISRRQIELAEARARDAGLDRLVRFDYADCSTRLPFPDASVDVIVNIESACHYGDRDRFLSECARVLTPGGRIVGCDWTAAEGILPADYERYIQPVCEAWVIKSLETRGSYTRMLTQYGLEVAEFVDFGEAVMDNARICEFQYRRYLFASREKALSETHAAWLKQLGALSKAWLAGHFRLQRYVARKNGAATP